MHTSANSEINTAAFKRTNQALSVQISPVYPNNFIKILVGRSRLGLYEMFLNEHLPIRRYILLKRDEDTFSQLFDVGLYSLRIEFQ